MGLDERPLVADSGGILQLAPVVNFDSTMHRNEPRLTTPSNHPI